MAEYPTRTCELCEEDLQKVRKFFSLSVNVTKILINKFLFRYFCQFDNPGYFSKNTIPEPNVKLKENSNLSEYIHGVPLTNQNPDLSVPPINIEKTRIEAYETPKHMIDPNTVKSSAECHTSCLRKDEEMSKEIVNIDCTNLKNDRGISIICYGF